ncbi:hypothetical protein [Burkholderia sp. MBR-1]|uniref:hypothetical protein n=1 Tax=Burkholderia sp. MBR-1 TaxID=2732364 RepID=UPI0015EEE56C|nr:hypothetical protein [Burkholderia sp. MBR-1]QMI49704.1 hypothetical protein MBR110_29925 [Burkholderia sp. MBR-1]
MPRPKTVQRDVLAVFTMSPFVAQHTVTLRAALPHLQSTQIAHAVAALQKSGDIRPDGPRRAATVVDLETGVERVVIVQYYLLVINSSALSENARIALGISKSGIEKMPFRLTAAAHEHIELQNALVGRTKGQSIKQKMRELYGEVGMGVDGVQLALSN